MRKNVSHHSSGVIIRNKKDQEFLFQKYDGGYPRISFRNSIHIIGGNFSRGDISPENLLERELREEFSQEQTYLSEGIERSMRGIIGEGTGAQIQTNFAPERYISELREEIIGKTRPWKDFLYTVPELDGRQPFSGVVSIYLADIDSTLFREGKRYLEEGKAIRNEGSTKIVTVDDLIGGEPTAWFTGPVMALYLDQDIPNPHQITLEEIGIPQDSWEHYLNQFSYSIPIN